MNGGGTLYRAGFVIGHDGDTHRIIADGAVLVRGNRVDYVGPARDFSGASDETVHLPNHMIMPGLVNLHCHTTGAPLSRSLLEDSGNPAFFMSGLYDYGRFRKTDSEETREVIRYSLAELLKSGATTIVEVGGSDYVDVYRESGIRTYLAPSYRSAAWDTPDGKKLEYVWDEEAGLAGLERAVDFVSAHPSGEDLIGSMLAPAQVDTCTPELLRESRRAADELGCRLHIHTSQSHTEVGVMIQRHGGSSLEFLEGLGILGPDVILAHTILTADHPDSNIPWCRDGQILETSGASIAHCPWVFGRRGTVMHSLGQYVRRGVNVGIGTDTFPQNMLAEMRWAAILSKTADNNPLSATAGTAFDAATVGGARALGREDLGRLSEGARADMVFVDCLSFDMVPVRDPIRNLVYGGSKSSVDKVMVDGKMLVDGGRVLLWDEDRLAVRVQEIAEKMWDGASARDPLGRSPDDLSPPTYPFGWTEDAGGDEA